MSEIPHPKVNAGEAGIPISVVFGGKDLTSSQLVEILVSNAAGQSWTIPLAVAADGITCVGVTTSSSFPVPGEYSIQFKEVDSGGVPHWGIPQIPVTVLPVIPG